MIKYCIKKWDKNKNILEEKIKSDTNLNHCDYEYLVKLVVDNILNSGIEDDYNGWDSGNITVIDNGDYQGTQLFMIPAKTYQPSSSEYLLTYQYYGSCSGCDTLQAIQEWNDDKPTEEQVKDYMILCKDIICNMIKPYNNGWNSSEEFETVEYKED